MSKWIWKFGAMEKYHNILVHTRRQNYGYLEPPVWKLYSPEPVVRFRKRVSLDRSGRISIHAQGDHSVMLMGEQFPGHQCPMWGAEEVELPAGEYTLQIRVMNSRTFPALYVDGIVRSDDTWLTDDTSADWKRAGSSPLFTDVNQEPSVFPFVYEAVEPVSEQVKDGGYLYDYGREMYALVRISGSSVEQAERENRTIMIRFGESEEEALDPKWCVIQFLCRPVNGAITLPAGALRYLWVENKCAAGKVKAEAQSQMLMLEKRASFSCSEKIINDVYNVAEYTFHLNCREFFLDGIKRDGWVWSADTYQCLFVNHYLYMDREMEKRTLTALGGGLPVVQYINTIMDYSFFWLMSLRDYYRTYGDIDYIRSIYPQARAVMLYCRSRCDDDGFIRGHGEDWVFIDWAPMDKTGAFLGEQILLAEAMKAFSEIEQVAFDITEGEAELIGFDRELHTGIAWDSEAKALRENILKQYYDMAMEVFIDSFESGKRYVSRQNNILAYLYLGLNRQVKKSLYERVILNEEIPAITTPYFKFYENQVHCEEGNPSLLEESIRTYYGSMLKLGATTLYEQYDPSQTGIEHYSMYGRPFEKSLCHAWSCSPIYLLGRFRLGVVNTGIAYDTYEVRPLIGDMQYFEGTVPLPGGEVHVAVQRTEKGVSIRVKTDVPGGTLVLGEKRYTLVPGATVTAVK